MIRLAKIEDKNRFCFFLFLDNKLRCFRYKNIIFGYVASPFILNYVIKYHVSKFIQDKYSEVLLQHFYVDNMIYSSCCVSEMHEMYENCNERMSKGGFELRSWSTNLPCLKRKCFLTISFQSMERPPRKYSATSTSPQPIACSFRQSSLMYMLQPRGRYCRSLPRSLTLLGSVCQSQSEQKPSCASCGLQNTIGMTTFPVVK